MHTLRERRIPYVRVLRNYRFGCISGTIFRDGTVCTKCIDKQSRVPGVIHGCYRDSTKSSLAAAASLEAQLRLGHWGNDGVYIAVSQYVADVARRAGIDPVRIVVRPNLVWPPPPLEAAGGRNRSGFLYVGRDDPNKGLKELVQAYSQSGCVNTLDIAGPITAPRGATVQTSVRYLGSLGRHAVLEAMRSAKAVVVPSIWPEPFGRVVTEALSVGTPVIASLAGGMESMAGPGVVSVNMRDPSALRAALEVLDSMDGNGYAQLTRAASDRFVDEFSSTVWNVRTAEAISKALAL